MSADDILGDLAAGREVEVEGSFSIDREKARLKMRQFRLADPRQYVLLLVQAAAHQGATRVEFRIDTDDMEVWFDGHGFSRSDLDDLFVSMFGHRGDASLRARQELAVGLDAALALNPRWVRVRSHHEGAASTIELRASADALPRAQSLAGAAEGGTRIHVKQRFRPGLLLEFVRSIRGQLAEAAILRDRVGYAEIAVLLDGDRISLGFPRGWSKSRVSLQAPGLRGVCGFRLDGATSSAQLDVLQAGVLIATHPLPSMPGGFVAVVDDLNLRKDVSQVDVVRDEAYAELKRQVADGFERSLLEVCRACEEDPMAWRIHPSLRDEMTRIAAERIADPSRMGVHAAEVHRFAALPIWRLVSGHRISTASLRQRRRVSFLRRVTERIEPFLESVLVEPDGERELLEAVFGASAVDQTSAYMRALEREANRAALMARAWSTSLGAGSFLARVPIEEDGFRGEVAFRPRDDQDPVVHLVYEGKLLETVVLARVHVDLPGFVAAIEGALQPTADWTGCMRDEALARAVHAVAQAAQRALVDIGSTVSVAGALVQRVRLLALIRLVWVRGFDESVYRAMRFSKKQAERWTKTLGRTQPSEPLSVSGPHPMALLPVFSRPTAGPASLYELRHHGVSDPLRVVEQRARRDEPIAGYVQCNAEGRRLLEEALGAAAIVDGAESYARDAARARFLARPKEPLRVPEACVVSTDFAHEGMSVQAGLLTPGARDGAQPGMARVRVFREQRPVGETFVRCDVAGVFLAVDWPEAPIVVEDDGLASAAERIVQGAVNEAPSRLFAAAHEEVRSKPRTPGVIEACRHLTVAVFQTTGDLLGFDDAHQEHGLEAGVRVLCAPVEGDRGRQAHAVALGTAWNEVRQVEMFARLGGRASLLDLLEEIRRYGAVLVVDERPEPSVRDPVPRVVLLVVPGEREMLERLLGTERLEDGQAFLERLRERKAFEDRPRLELELEASSVWVKVLVGEGDLRGEVGLGRGQLAIPSASIIACRQGREVCKVNVHALRVPMVGVLEAEGFGEGRKYVSLSAEDRARVAKACTDAMPRLADALAGRWRTLADDEKLEAANVARAVAVSMLEGKGRRGMHVAGAKALAGLPLFEHASGVPWSLEQIVRAHDEGEALHWVPSRTGLGGHEVPKLTFVGRDDAAALLREVFGTLVDYGRVLEQRREGAKRRAGAPRMPEPPPSAIATIAVKGRGLEGLLWIDPRIPGFSVALGDAERVAGFAELSNVFAVGGAISGPGVHIDPQWSSATVSRRGAAFLVKRARELYEMVLERFDPESAKRGRSWSEDRDALRRLAMRMSEQWRTGTKPGNAPTRRLYRLLKELPLLEIDSGHAVRLETYLREIAKHAEPLPERRPQERSASASRATSEPKPPESPSEAPPHDRSPEAGLLDAVRAELRRVTRQRSGKLSSAMLDLIAFGPVEAGALAQHRQGRVHIDPAHAVSREALRAAGAARARHVSMIASSVYSAFNHGRAEITDADEVTFHTLHARHLAT